MTPLSVDLHTPNLLEVELIVFCDKYSTLADTRMVFGAVATMPVSFKPRGSVGPNMLHVKPASNDTMPPDVREDCRDNWLSQGMGTAHA